jgi:glycerol-3-phosphate dehydrogenase
MKLFDVAVIGGGVLGCFAARALCRYDVSAVLIESREDVCTGISRANTAIVYPGYDNEPGSLKAALTVRSNADFDKLCKELDVPFSRCGSLMLSCGETADAVLRKKLENGMKSHVPDISLISGDKARELEPGLVASVRSALYAPRAGTVNPWKLGIAAYENALANGCTAYLNTELLSIKRDCSKYVLETTCGEIGVSGVINCAGLSADSIYEMLFAPSIRIFPDAADYLVLSRGSVSLRHIILHEPEDKSKCLIAVPTTEGNVLMGPTERPGSNFNTDSAGLNSIKKLAGRLLPEASKAPVIRSFGAVRPNPHRVVYKNGEYIPDGSSIGSFAIANPEPGFISFIGIKTPGLTCANELGKLAADRISTYLNLRENQDFKPERRAIRAAHGTSFEERSALVAENPDYGDILCFCEDISKAEVLEAIHRGAVTVDGVKRRVGASMGVCQGARCQMRIVELLTQELGIPQEAVRKDGGASYVLGGQQI